MPVPVCPQRWRDDRQRKGFDAELHQRTIGFGPFAKVIGAKPKSLMRMFGLSDNPAAKNLLGVIGYLQAAAGVSLAVRKIV